MGRRARRRPSPGSPGAALPRVIVGCSGGRLLWGDGTNSWQDPPSRSSFGRSLRLPSAHGDNRRTCAPSLLGQSGAVVPATCLSTRVQSSGEWRLLSPCPERSTGARGGRRGLGNGPARCRSAGRRRRTGAAEEARRGSWGGGPARSSQEKEPFTRQKEPTRREEEKETKKGQGQDGGAGEWPACGQGRDKGAEGALCRNGPRPKRRSEETGREEGPKIHRQEEEQAEQFEQQRKPQQEHVIFERGGDDNDGGRVHRGNQSACPGGTLPGDPGVGNSREHASELAHDVGGRRRATGDPTGGPFVLPECSLPEGSGSPRAGAPDAVNSDRRPIERASCPCPGHPLPEGQVTGGSTQRDPLGSSPKGRACRGRGHSSHSQRRVEGSQEGKLPGLQDGMAEPSRQCEQRAAERERQEQARERGDSARGTKGGDAKRKSQGLREEVRQVYEDQMHGRIGAPEATTGADLNLLRECLEGSHATKAAGVFTPTVAPVMISPTEPKQLHSGDRGAFQNPGHPFCHRDHSVLDSANLDEHIKKKDLSELSGLRVYEMGPKIQQWLLGVIPLRSKSTGRKTATTLFPLPTSGEVLLGCFPSLDPLGVSWLSCICLGLNSMWGDNTAFEGAVTPLVKECLGELVKDVERIGALSGCLEHFDWEVFFSTRSIDYKGDVK